MATERVGYYYFCDFYFFDFFFFVNALVGQQEMAKRQNRLPTYYVYMYTCR